MNKSQQHYIREPDLSGDCYVAEYWWLPIKSKRLYALCGNQLYLSKAADSAPYEMIDLTDSQLIVTEEKEGVQLCLNHFKVVLKVQVSEWKCAMEKIRSIASLRTSPTSICYFPFKYICVNLILDWFTLHDLILVDCALSKMHREELLGLYNEFGVLLSEKFLSKVSISSVILHKFLAWAVPRGLRCYEIYAESSVQVFRLILDRNVFGFSTLTSLNFPTDSAMLYQLLQGCPNLVYLDVNKISNKSRLLLSVVVHTRQLQTLFSHSEAIESNALPVLAIHHRRVYLLQLQKCPFLVFRTCLWYQEPPQFFSCSHKTLQECDELCVRTTSIDTLIASNSDHTVVLRLLDMQCNLTSVTLIIHRNFSELPAMLSKCANVVHFFLHVVGTTRTCGDWSCLMQSKMKLKQLVLLTQSDKILEHAAYVLDSASTLSINNDHVTDDQFEQIVRLNGNNLTDLHVSYAKQLTNRFLSLVGEFCVGLKCLSFGGHRLGHHLIEYTRWGSSTLQTLKLGNDWYLMDALPTLCTKFPALRYLIINGWDLAVEDIIEILKVLGSHLFVLTLLKCLNFYRVKAAASRIAGCCIVNRA